MFNFKKITAQMSSLANLKPSFFLLTTTVCLRKLNL